MKHLSNSRAAPAPPGTLEARTILAMMIQRKPGEITLDLTDEQYRKLCNR